MTDERRAQIVPPAQHQTDRPAASLLHTGTAGAVVQKSGQLRSEYRSEGRIFAREVAKHVNARQDGAATAFVYEESFGHEDRIHFLIHLTSLDTYYALVEMGDQDAAYRASIQDGRVQDQDQKAGAWDRLFVDGTVRSDVLLPRSRPEGPALNSADAGIVVVRSAQIGVGFQAEALEVAQEVADAVNGKFGADASAMIYDEAFGEPDRIHWLLHLRDLTVYGRLRDALALTARPGTFVDGSLRETALTPHHWGLYATRQASSQAG